MTVSHRKTKVAAKPDDQTAAEPGVQYHCDVCEADITLTVRVRCAGGCKEFDLCGSCFCSGAEAKHHKAWHDYRIVEQHAYPIFTEDWGADEELLLIDGCQTYGLGNWADIADHIGNRTKEEVEAHYVSVFVEGRDGTESGDQRAGERLQNALTTHPPESRQLPLVGPNPDFEARISADEFHQAKRRRIADLRSKQAALPIGSQAKGTQPPKPLVSAPTSHHELSGFMPGRLEFETEHEQEAEVLTKDMEFGKVYRFGGELLPSEEQALGGKAVGGRSRMEASGRGGPSSRGTGTAAKGKLADGDETTNTPADETQPDADMSISAAPDGAAAVNDEEEEEGQDQANPKAAGEQDDTARSQDVEAANGQQSTAPAAEAEPAERPPADWDEDNQDLELKLMILEMYNERLERRTERKTAILERGLVEVRRRQAAEKRRPKEERDLLTRVRHYAQLQTPQDFEEFFDGLCYQDTLTRLALRLQEYRRMGVTTFSEAARYETEKAERLKRAQSLAENGTDSGARLNRRPGVRDSETPFDDGPMPILPPPRAATPASTSGPAQSASKRGDKEGPQPPKSPRKPPKPLDLSSHPSLHLLTRPEQVLCSVQRIQPSAFLVMKKEMIQEYIRRQGRMSRRESRTLFKMDVNKVGKVYDLLEEQGYLAAAKAFGWDGGPDGIGVPPGSTEPSINGHPASPARLNRPHESSTAKARPFAANTASPRPGGPPHDSPNRGTPGRSAQESTPWRPTATV
ncbi:unnamed protein product [Parajaminaea phylloscopi]